MPLPLLRFYGRISPVGSDTVFYGALDLRILPVLSQSHVKIWATSTPESHRHGGSVLAPTSSPRPSLAPYPEEPVQELLRRSAKRFPDKAAVIDGDRTFTYKQMEDLSDRFAAVLASGGMAVGDRVGVFAPNCVEFAIGFFVILKAGGIPSTVNSSYVERELANQMIDCGATVLLVHEAMLEVAENSRGHGLDVRQLIVIRPDSQEPGSFWGMIESATGRLPEEVRNPGKPGLPAGG